MCSSDLRCLKNRRHDFDLGVLEALDEERRKLIAEVEDLKARRNEGSRKVGEAKRTGADASSLMEEIRSMGERIRERDTALAEVEGKLNGILMTLPNRLHETTPVGADENDNPVDRRHKFLISESHPDCNRKEYHTES